MTSHSIEGLSDGGLREQYARIIDPEAFCAAFVACCHFHARREDALAKAIAILALSAAPERMEGGGWDSASQSQPCAEKGPQPFSHDAPLSDGKGE